MRRATANIRVDLDGPVVERRLGALAEASDVLALQESPRNRNPLLASLGGIWLWPLLGERKVKGEWTFHRPRLGGGPIGVRNELGETALTCKAKILVGPGFVGRIPERKSVLGPSYATRLKSKRPDGSIVVRYNIHLTASVQKGRVTYRTDAAHALRVARHRAERAKLARLVKRDQAKYGKDNVEVYGDVNFHHMRIPGLTGWWSIAPDEPTFGGRAIDGIWTGRRPDDVDFMDPLVAGEHRHVITRGRS